MPFELLGVLRGRFTNLKATTTESRCNIAEPRKLVLRNATGAAKFLRIAGHRNNRQRGHNFYKEINVHEA